MAKGKWETIYDGDRSSNTFTMDSPDELHLACCDCGSTHALKMKIVNGKIHISVKKLETVTRKLRKEERHSYINRSKVLNTIERIR